jgi:hypothetical protein
MKIRVGTLQRVMRESADDSEDSKPSYPANHLPIARVPRGGSCCKNCKWVSTDLQHCGNEYFQKWNESSKLPMAADEMCTDWWETREENED